MASLKIDYKKEFKDLYFPRQKPMLIDVPEITFIAIDGKGDPQSEEYQSAVQALYSLSYTIKMSKMSGNQPKDYFEYVVPPLEGLWWMKDKEFDINKREEWIWTSMIRQPEFVTPGVFDWAIKECMIKKPETTAGVEKAEFITFTEGLCVQVMHIGPYTEEAASIEKIKKFTEENDLTEDINDKRKHHEIYLGDPRKTNPEKLRTVLRIPVRENKYN